MAHRSWEVGLLSVVVDECIGGGPIPLREEVLELEVKRAAGKHILGDTPFAIVCRHMFAQMAHS